MVKDGTQDQKCHSQYVSRDVRAVGYLSRYSDRCRGMLLSRRLSIDGVRVQCGALGSWYEVLLVLLNALSTFLIRWLPKSWIAKREGRLLIMVSARCLLIPIAFAAVNDFSSPFVIAPLIATLGMSQG